MKEKEPLATRRELLRWLGIAAAGGYALEPREIFAQAPRHIRRLGAKAGPAPGYFTPEQKQAVAALCDLLIPSDADSPGACEAGVPEFMDRLLHVSDRATQQVWSGGLKNLEGFAGKKYGNAFTALDPARQENLLRTLAENEFHPHTDLERFFVEAKRLIGVGYYTSQAGLLKDLKYQGNTYLAEYPGCEKQSR